MKQGVIYSSMLLLGLSLLAAGPSAASAAPAWVKLGGKHQNVTPTTLAVLMKKDGVKNPAALLGHRYLVRLQIWGAGGGSALHSEVVVRFRSPGKKVLAKAWSPGAPQPGRAQLGPWGSCKVRKGAVGRACPVKYNGRGFQDVTRSFQGRNVLFVHDPATKSQGNSVVWFASDRSQEFMWYYVVPHTAWPSFGFGRLAVRKYALPASQPPARLPGVPLDPGTKPAVPTPTPTPSVTPAPTPPVVAKPTPPPVRPPTAKRPVASWTTVSALHRGKSKAALRQQMKRDGIPYPDYLLAHRFLVRLALRNAGGGSASRSELELRLTTKPKKALGKAWADRTELGRAQLGGRNRCTELAAGKGGPAGHRCPVQFNGIGWRNLISAFTDRTMRLITNPNNNNSGNVVLWLAFDRSQTGLAHKFVLPATRPSFGKGQVRVGLYAVAHGPPLKPVTPPGSPGTTPSGEPGWKPLGATRHLSAARAQLASRMRRDGVKHPGYLLRHKYLVRLSLSRAGGGRGQRSEVLLRTTRRPRAALGVAWSDHRQRWGAQLGGASKCKPLPRPRNPYGRWRGASRPRGHVCPLQYNGIGWRNLISGFTENKVMLITAPHGRGRGNQLLWIAFDSPQQLAFRSVVPGSRGGIFGALRAEKFVVGPAAGHKDPFAPKPRTTAPPRTTPVDPGGPGKPPLATPPPSVAGLRFTPRTGAHKTTPKNSLYYVIRRDGFKNPWFLLKQRYVIRVEIRSRGHRAETVLNFSDAPVSVVGQGKGGRGGRSRVQVGTLANCRKNPRQPAFCPLHFAGLGWRNLTSGVKGNKSLVVVNAPDGSGKAPTTVLWLSFANPQSTVRVGHLPTAPGRATVRIQRYRW